MSKRYYVETLPSGQKQFVHVRRPRSRSHHGHHHHPHLPHLDHHHHQHGHHHDDCAHVTVEEWTSLLERERSAREQVDSLKGENYALKGDLATTNADLVAANGEIRRLEGHITGLNGRIQTLCDDNAALRTSLDNATDQIEKQSRDIEQRDRVNEKLVRKVNRLERENDSLWGRIRQLERDCHHHHHHLHNPFADTIENLRRTVHDWKRKFENLDRLVDDQVDIINQQRDKINLYERLLRRHRIIY